MDVVPHVNMLEGGMKFERDELSSAVQTALSLGAVAAVAFAGSAAAQTTGSAEQGDQQQPKTLQTIMVTGSHVRRVDLETSNPVVTVTAQQIQATGKLTIGAVIQDLSVVTGGARTPTVNNTDSNDAGNGATMVGLRGLGAKRTLLLVDGQRVITKDLNAIPAVAVERIEVLTDGASAVYGSDAIGGVINIILKSHYQGAQFSANYGVSDRGDGQRTGASFMFGQTSDAGNVLAGVSYNKFDPVEQSAREWSENALSLTDTAGGGLVAAIGGSSYAARDFISISSSLAAAFGCANNTGRTATLSLNESAFTATDAPTASADYHCFGVADRYNYATVNFLLTPQERTNAFFKGTYHLTDNIDFNATVLHNKTSSGYQFAPAVFGTSTVGGLLISKNSYYNPFGVDFSRGAGNLYRSRLFPSGNRSSRNSFSTDEIMIDIRGNFTVMDKFWTWDVGYTYGHWSAVRTIMGLPNQGEIVPGLGPSFMNADGQVQCSAVALPNGTAANDPNAIPLTQCIPWNPFNLNSPSAQKVLTSAAAAALKNFYSKETIKHADLTGGLFDLPAGTVQLAGGVLWRTEYTNNTIDPVMTLNPATGTCTLGAQCSAHLQGGFNVKEAYAEAFIPVLKDLPFISSLNVTLGDRWSKYSTFGSTNNWKIGLEWRPISDLLLRGTVSTVFRAPNVTEVFQAPVTSAPLLTGDPCDFVAPSSNPNAPNPNAGNPACSGVPATGTFIDQFVAQHQQINALTSGSAYSGFPLGPETGRSFDFGVVYSPHFVPGLSLTADYWRIYLKDVITNVGVQTVLNACFNGQSRFCPLIERIQNGPSAGQPFVITQPTANLGRIDLQGVDVQANYRLPALSFGQFTIGLKATYLSEFKIQTAPGQAGNTVFGAAGVMGTEGSALEAACPLNSGGICFFPRIKAQAAVSWQLGPWDATWRVRYTHPFEVPGDLQTGHNIEGLDRYGAWIYNDFTVGYNIKPIDTRIDIGVDNVFDKDPPMLFANRSLNANTDPQDFDVLGRYYWGRITVKF